MATQQIQIADDTLDGYDNGSTWDGRTGTYETQTDFPVKKTGGVQWDGGIRFLSVTPNQGATINSATITLTNRLAGNAVTDLTIFADDVDNAPAWSGSSRPQSGFTNTTASGALNSPDLTLGNTNVITVTSVVQEIVDRGSWVSGNAIRFRIIATATYGFMRFSDYQITPSDTSGETAILDIDYTDAGAGGIHQSIDPRKRGRIVYVR